MTDFKLNLKIPRYIERLKQQLKIRMAKVALLVESKIKQSLSISNLGGSNPSSPGEAPHAGTGALRNSITNQISTDGSDVVASIGSFNGPGAAYALRLELGFTGKDSKGRNYNQAPRPFIRPAVQLNKATILKIITKG